MSRPPRATAVRRRRNWLKRLPTTREGLWFLGATLLVGAAAVNAGLNLLFLVFGMMLFLILASGVMSETCLRRLAVTRRLPAVVHAGAPFLMGIVVRNNKTQMPTFSLEVEDLTEDKPVDRRCYFLKIPAGREQETAYRNQVARRGLHRLTGFRISTRFPFGLLRKSHEIAAPAEIIVYPELVAVPSLLAAGGRALVRNRASSSLARSGEFHGLREYREGDDPRQIHWRSSARRGRMLLREQEDDAGGNVLVRLDASCTGLLDEEAAFEHAVSMTASVALWFLRQGFDVGIAVGKVTLPPRSSPSQSRSILTALATVSLQDARAMAPAPGHFALQARVQMSSQGAHVRVEASRGAAA